MLCERQCYIVHVMYIFRTGVMIFYHMLMCFTLLYIIIQRRGEVWNVQGYEILQYVFGVIVPPLAAFELKIKTSIT